MQKMQSHLIVLALNIITLKSNDYLRIKFCLRFNPITSNGSMSMKLSMVPDHERIRVRKELHSSNVGPSFSSKVNFSK